MALTGILLYASIIFFKTIEVSLATTRILLITKGKKITGALIGFFEVILWIIIAGSVLQDISSDYFKIISYALGFSFGNYLGTYLTEWMGIGYASFEVVVLKIHGDVLAKELRDFGLAVTEIDGRGMNHARTVLIMKVSNKKRKEVIQKITQVQENAFITITDTTPVYGGFGTIKK